MTVLNQCAICDGQYSVMREHCPYCGARRAFLASHSYEPYQVIVHARCSENLYREIVRARTSTFCRDERAIVESRAIDITE